MNEINCALTLVALIAFFQVCCFPSRMPAVQLKSKGLNREFKIFVWPGFSRAVK